MEGRAAELQARLDALEARRGERSPGQQDAHPDAEVPAPQAAPRIL